MQNRSIILKQDARGQVQTPVARREELVTEFERSGLPGSQFARLAGLKYATFMQWVAKKRRRGSADKPKERTPLFVEAIVGRPEVASAVVVEFGGGARMSLSNARQVPLAAQLLNAIQKSC